MFNKRNLLSIKNRRTDNVNESSQTETDLNSFGNVRLFKRRTIPKISVTGNNLSSSEKNEEVPLESVVVDLQSTEVPINRATSTYEIDTDKSIDNRSILERNLEIGKKILAGELESNIYRGQGAYKPIMNIKEDSIAASKYTGLYGPVRASATNVRTTLRIDYQPDICKDYKETGYCGFGDTCKFLHDRSDYKSGWQMEKEWEQQQAEKRLKMQKKLDKWHKKIQLKSKGIDIDEEDLEEESGSDTDNSDNDSESESDSDTGSSSRSETESDSKSELEESKSELEESKTKLLKNGDKDDKTFKKLIKYKAKKLKIPFCCLYCKKLWKLDMNPVVTSCGHYFCEKCAIEAYSKKNKCPKCNIVQDGIMNRASAVEKLMESLVYEEL